MLHCARDATPRNLEEHVSQLELIRGMRGHMGMSVGREGEEGGVCHATHPH